jgi:hypothetical protein
MGINSSAFARKDGKGFTQAGKDALKNALQNARVVRGRYFQKFAKLANANAGLCGFVPLCDSDAQHAYDLCKKANPRKKNIDNAEAGRATGWGTRGIEYKGSFKGWRGEALAPTFQAVYRISRDGAQLAAVLDGGPHVLNAPRGYYWGQHAGQPALFRAATGAEYHIDTDDIRTGAVHCRAALLKLEEVRKERNRAAKITPTLKKAEIDLKTSWRAGNCAAGSRAFAQKLGLDPTKSYTVAAILKALKKCKTVTDFERERFNLVLAMLSREIC